MCKVKNRVLYSSFIAIVGFMLAVGVALPARAYVVELKFNTLPSAQGWTYTSSELYDEYREYRIFSIYETTLHQNSIGRTGRGSVDYYYILRNVVNSTKPFILTVRARVLRSESLANGGRGGFAFGASTGNEDFNIYMNTSTIQDSFQTKISSNTPGFHEYCLEGTPGVGYRFFTGMLKLM